MSILALGFDPTPKVGDPSLFTFFTTLALPTSFFSRLRLRSSRLRR